MTVLGILGGEPKSSATCVRGRLWTAGGGIPATRELEVTLLGLLMLAGGGVAIAAVSTPVISRVAIAATLVALTGAAIVLRAVIVLTPPVLRSSRRRDRGPLRTAVIGTVTSAVELEADLRRAQVGVVTVAGAIAPRLGRKTTGDALDLGTLGDVRRIVAEHRIDVLLVAPGAPRSLVADAVMRSCEGDPVRLCELSSFYEEVFGRVPVTGVDAGWFQCVLHPRFREQRARRVFDVLVAGALALAALPLLGGLALVICRDGGPVLYRQRRIGRDGRPFVIYKLRTMRWEPDGEGARWATRDDARVTPLGRVLRRTHLDELPQLLNVLRGDMAIVGPRPEQPELAAELEQRIPGWRGRYRHKPGLTGWAQIRGGYGGSHDGSSWKLAHDLYYLRRRSLMLDAAILLQTVSTVMFAPQYVEPPETPFVVRRRWRLDVSPQRQPMLVTGGAGFIGSHLVDALLAAGHHVVVVDDLSSGSRANLAGALIGGAHLYEADVTDAEAMRECFAEFRPEVVFHLAAQIDVASSLSDPLHDTKVNVAGTVAVLEASVASGVRRFVLASSGGAIYGNAARIPTPEETPEAPISPYGAAKAAAEHYAVMYGRLHGLSVLSLRMANVYGPRQGASGEGGAIARFCQARLAGAPAPVFGDGLQTRDYVHVRDAVAAWTAAGESLVTGALNVGTGIETTVIELVETLSLRPDFQPARAGEVRRSCLDASAARVALRWRPQLALAPGLAETLDAAAGLAPGETLLVQSRALG